MDITFKAELWAPMEGKGWTFITMPKAVSSKLGKKGRIAIEGTINGHPFRSSAFPNGEGSHQVAINADMRAGGGADAGDTATFIIRPATDAVAVEMPPALTEALENHAGAKAQWDAITPKARDEWVKWIAGAKKEETRTARLEKTLERLADGAKRPSD